MFFAALNDHFDFSGQIPEIVPVWKLGSSVSLVKKSSCRVLGKSRAWGFIL
ncbi:hypothetical protein X474_06595 [Dethiosulfatarculus sandiegensis]|uniref:Uncharacterized protein n=1 Tax=Dethiosulfatarculus sandiegensis TaxID=1429043 RepID=A0A0D2HWQ8_9BACT|nr:hypothetical protein X474_06595 [Dethiosulfatarculus sandiegensis]